MHSMNRKKLHPATFILLSLMVIGLAFVGCEGDQGPAGPSGVNPDSPPIITVVVAAPDSVGTGESTILFVSAYDLNGDAMIYAWTATSGTLSIFTVLATNYILLSGIGLY